MATAADLRNLEEACPWLEEDFRADLDLLAGGTAAAARMYATDLRVIARLASRVPRCAFDETGASPWTSFRREVAVARRITDRAAARLIRCALRVTSVLPHTMGMLQAGVLTPRRAEVLVCELEVVSDDVAARVDAELAEVITVLPTWRIENEVRQAVLRLDPEAVLPDPDELAHLDQTQLTPPTDLPPVLPRDKNKTQWTWLGPQDDKPPPF